VVENDLYLFAGYARSGYLSDAWCLRLVDETPACQADHGGSER
jgi:hypothetical protein